MNETLSYKKKRCYDKQLKFQLVLSPFLLDDGVFFVMFFLHNRQDEVT